MAAKLLALLLLAVAAAAPCARAATATTTDAAPLALGGDRLVFHGRRASALWRAAATTSPAPAAGADSTLALRFGRLAELSNTTGDVVRRVPSLAKLTPSQISTGTKTGSNGTLDFVLLAYDGAALGLTPCPTPAPTANTTAAEAEAEAATLAAAAKTAAAAAAVEIELLLVSGSGAGAPVALPYANETVVVPLGGFKWSIDVQRWPFCGANNTLALDVVLRGEDTYDAAPRVFDGPGNATHGSDSVTFGDGLYVPEGLAGVLGGASDGDNDDADEAVAEREEGGKPAAAAAGAPLATHGGGACAAALQGLGNATDGGLSGGEARLIAPAWFMPNVLTPYAVAVVGSEGSAAGSASPSSPPSSPPPARRSLLAEEEAGAILTAAQPPKDDDDDDKKDDKPPHPHHSKFNCSERAGKQRERQAEAASARLVEIEAEAAAILTGFANGSASTSASALAAAAAAAASASTTTTTTAPAASRKLLREPSPQKDADDDNNNSKAARASLTTAGRGNGGRTTRVTAAAAAAAAANAQRAREEGAAAAAARANAAAAAQTAATAAKDACASPSALLAANRALGLPRIRARARPGTPLGDALVAAEAAASAAAATSGAAVAAAADVAGDVLCPASPNALSAKIVNASSLGGGNGRVRSRAPERGRLATMLLSEGVAAKLELPAFAVDGDPADPAALQLPVDVLVLPDAEDASSAVTRYLFPQPSSASARLHYDPTTSAAPAEDAYSTEEIQDAASAPVPTFDGFFMMDAAETGEGAGDAAAGGGKAKSAATVAAAASATTAAAAGAGLLLLLLV